MKIEDGRCIYVLYNPTSKLTKIGVSDNVKARKSAIEQACGCPLDLMYFSKHLLCAEKYETEVHVKFKNYRKLGEWFDILDHISVIEEIADTIKTATEDPIVETYKKGMSITRIAEEYQVTRQAILARLKKYGVYDSNGHIYERDPNSIPNLKPQPRATPPRENKYQHISTIDDKYDDTTFLDGEKPILPLKNLKRIEPNLNSNGEWFQISLFKDGEFIYSYTKDINKARAYIQGVRAVAYSNINN